MGRAGRARAVERFAWPAIAQQTVALYQRLALSADAPTRLGSWEPTLPAAGERFTVLDLLVGSS